MLDQELVTEDDLGAQFLISEADIGKPRAEAALPEMQKLNPRVNIKVETQNILLRDSSTLGTYFAQYTLVVATDLSITGFESYNNAAHFANRPFYAVGTHGLYGFVFADLVEHTYLVTRDKPNVATKPGPESATREIISSVEKRADNGKMTEIVTKREKYQPLILANASPLPEYYHKSQRRLKSVTPLLPYLRATWEFEKQFQRLPASAEDSAPAQETTQELKVFTTLAIDKGKELQLPEGWLKTDLLRSFIGNLGTELAMTTSFVGAAAAQDISNVLMGKDQPIQNMMFFDGETMNAPVYALTPIVS